MSDISIFMITYNHEAYISQAIESIIAQQVSVPYKLIIGEDGSTDNTRKICIKYVALYPDKIELLDDVGNLGMHLNCIRTLEACTGTYVAMCEGDDHWIDPFKLQKQVDFLESNVDYAICFHDVKIFDQITGGYTTSLDVAKVEDTTTIEDLARGNYMHTPSVLFRNHGCEIPREMDLAVIDYPLHMLNARFGKIKRLKEPMAVYRIHEEGVWSMKNRRHKDKGMLTMYVELIRSGLWNDTITKIMKQTFVQKLFYIVNIDEVGILPEDILRDNLELQKLYETHCSKLKNRIRLTATGKMLSQIKQYLQR